MRRILLMFMVFFIFSIPCFPAEFQIGSSAGIYYRSDSIMKSLLGKTDTSFGLDITYYYNNTLGFSFETNYFSSSGETSIFKQPFLYKELHLMPGLNCRFNLIRFSPSTNFSMYLKGSGLLILYSEEFEGTSNGTAFGLSTGVGVILWLKRIGFCLEGTQNIASKDVMIEGVDRMENMSFSGTRLAFKCYFKL